MLQAQAELNRFWHQTNIQYNTIATFFSLGTVEATRRTEIITKKQIILVSKFEG